VGVSDFGKGREFVLWGVEVLDDKLDCAVLLLDYGVITLVFLLNDAAEVSNLAESSLYAFSEYYCSLAMRGVRNLGS
jgi:hypothetical protein